ncbi:MAG: phosphoribosylformylglycinamidine synthase subunit PurL [Candidatus Zixiibacteriota bacterium]
MVYRIVVRKKDSRFDIGGIRVLGQIKELGIRSVSNVAFASVYYLDSDDMTLDDVKGMAGQLLVDTVTEDLDVEVYDVNKRPQAKAGECLLEVSLNHGVTDSTAWQVVKAVRQRGFNCKEAKLARFYTLTGQPTEEELNRIGIRILYNPVIEHIVQTGEEAFKEIVESEPVMEELPLPDMNDDELMALSKDRLWLNLIEMRKLKEYYTNLGRAATDVEIETLAQTWSEHCSHKVFRANIFVDGELQKPLIKRLKDLTYGLNKDWCWSVFVDDSGVIEFDSDWGVCFKVETHNKPSGIEPFGGAHTGIGGVIRDIMGTGLGAKPIANTNVLCFAPPDTPWEKLPPGLLHPKRVMRQVVAGIEDYGNKMGIPTINGSICFSERFTGLPLVYAGCVGIIEKSIVEKQPPQPGDRIILMGGLTGRDGIHGATFSSGELTKKSESVSAQSVQIGHPLVEKMVLDALADIRDERLFHAITDCGGGGLSSAIGEMGNPGGAFVDLSCIPKKYPLPFISDFWISESQERMIIAVPPENVKRVFELCKRHDVEVADIGEFTDNGRLVINFGEKQVADMDMDFLHNGCPKREFKLTNPPKPKVEEKFIEPPTGQKLVEMIHLTNSELNACSKENVARVYDHEVQARTVVKPFMGKLQRNPSDGAALKPIYDSPKGVIVANGINVRYGIEDPRKMARSVVDEAVRQIVAMGGSPEKIAILDNFSMPSPEIDKTVLDLHYAIVGLCEAAQYYQTPIISGKDSFYNQYNTGDGTLICVPPTLLVSSICVVDDVAELVTSCLSKTGSRVYLLGKTKEELEMSSYFVQTKQSGSAIPDPDLELNLKIYKAMHTAINQGLVLSAHDCSDGGLGTALSELVIGGEFGLEIDLAKVPYDGRTRNDFILFSESNGRIVVEVEEKDAANFEGIFKGLPCAQIGVVTAENRLKLTNGTENLVSIPGDELYAAWSGPISSII